MRQEQKDSQIQECMNYFRERPVFHRIFSGFREKYRSYASFSGTVILQKLSPKDREDLEGFFQRSFHGQKSVSVSAARFEKALNDSRFDCFSPTELLEYYFQERMTGKREEQKEQLERWKNLLLEERVSCCNTPAESWIDEIAQTEGDQFRTFRRFFRDWNEGMEETKRMLRLGIRIINEFPYRQNKAEYLAVFAARVTGNPHEFDEGSVTGSFFQLLVRWDVEKRNIPMEQSGLFPALQKQRLYMQAGILKDDVSNYVMLSGVHAWKKGNSLHRGMEGFALEREPVQVPLSVIASWDRVNCPGQEIFIVENPSVFSLLCGTWRGEKACMCMNGQPRLSSLLLLDLLEKTETKVFYAGDFDPEGLLIAQKIKQYYKGEVEFWHMSVEEYDRCCSSEKISQKRMKMLKRISDEELIELAMAIEKRGMAGYQEGLFLGL